MSFTEKLRKQLQKTRSQLFGKLQGLFGQHSSFDESTMEALEEILITADIGVSVSHDVLQRIKKRLQKDKNADMSTIKTWLEDELIGLLSTETSEGLDVRITRKKPYVVLMVGVNGTGKTTTIGKLAARFTARGLKVLLVAGDTFRAAAAEQLQIWADRAGAELATSGGADPAALVFDAVSRARDNSFDVVLVDTAGRLHTKVNLMEELKKVHRVIAKQIADAPHDTLLVLDGTTGQNAVAQAKQFSQAVPLSGLILTKLDGTAKGGAIFAIQQAMQIPIHYIGVGEAVDDLVPFNADDFVKAVAE